MHFITQTVETEMSKITGAELVSRTHPFVMSPEERAAFYFHWLYVLVCSYQTWTRTEVSWVKVLRLFDPSNQNTDTLTLYRCSDHLMMTPGASSGALGTTRTSTRSSHQSSNRPINAIVSFNLFRCRAITSVDPRITLSQRDSLLPCTPSLPPNPSSPTKAPHVGLTSGPMSHLKACILHVCVCVCVCVAFPPEAVVFANHM